MYSRPNTVFDNQLEAHKKSFETKRVEVNNKQQAAASRQFQAPEMDNDNDDLSENKEAEDVSAVKGVKINEIDSIFDAIYNFHRADIQNDNYQAIATLNRALNKDKDKNKDIDPMMERLSGTTSGVRAFFQRNVRYNEAQTLLRDLRADCAKRMANCDKVMALEKKVTDMITIMEKKKPATPLEKEEYREKVTALKEIRDKIPSVSNQGDNNEDLVNPEKVQQLLEAINTAVNRTHHIKKNPDGTIRNTGGDTAKCLLEMIATLKTEQKYSSEQLKPAEYQQLMPGSP